MSAFYKIAYQVGFHPWEDLADHPPFADTLTRLIARADVTKLRASGVGTGFRLVLDTGTFHGLTGPQRAAMGREITAVAAVDATVLLDVFAPGRRGPLPRG